MPTIILEETHATLAELIAQLPPGEEVAILRDGKRIVTASKDKTARVWDAESGKELRKLEGHTSLVNGVAFSPDGKRIVTASADKTARVWDAE